MEKNRRQFTRILFSIKAELLFEEQAFVATIHDISLNGALISISSTTPLKGNIGILRFQLNEEVNESEVVMHIAVVHQSGHDLGLQCNAIDIESITVLRRLIELNLGDESQLNKELAQLNKNQ